MGDDNPQDSLIKENHDPLIRFLNKIVVYCVRLLAVLMVLVVIWSLVDVVVQMYRQASESILTAFNVDQLISLFGLFLVVLIAVEIFLNIIFYLKRDAIHVPLVLSTALTAIARKVIVLDYKIADPQYIYATAAVIVTVGITYWLVTKKS